MFIVHPKFRRFLGRMTVALVLVASVLAEETPEQAAAHRAELMKERHYGEAYQLYAEAMRQDPTNLGLIYNTGLSAYLDGRPIVALPQMLKMKKLVPDDKDVREKLLCIYEAMGDQVLLEAERAEMLKLHADGKVEAFAKADRFYRDHFVEGDNVVEAAEFFPTTGKDQARYEFTVTPKFNFVVKTRYLLITFDKATKTAISAGQIKEGQRLYSLMHFEPDGVKGVFNGYAGEPAYQQVKADVLKILRGELKETSALEDQ